MAWDEGRLSRHLKLRDLNVLMTLAGSGSMGKAAEKLSLSQPAISKAVADMERALGVRLFDRTSQGVEVTIYGRALLGRALAVFDELKQGVQHIEFLSSPNTGELRVGSTIALALGFTTFVIADLLRRYPGLVLHLLPNEPEATFAFWNNARSTSPSRAPMGPWATRYRWSASMMNPMSWWLGREIRGLGVAS